MAQGNRRNLAKMGLSASEQCGRDPGSSDPTPVVPKWLRVGIPIVAFALAGLLATFAKAADPALRESEPRVAGVVTEYRENAHADVILGRLLETDTLDNKGPRVPLKLVSLFTDQVPPNDLSRALAREHGFTITQSAADAVLAPSRDPQGLHGILLIAEHGDYPRSPSGQTIYPKRRLFAEIVAALERTGRVVPLFIDKHLADNWEDAKWIYDVAREKNVPLMAGSSLPVAWRCPPADVHNEQPLEEITAVSYGALDAYGFHALEIVQCLAEQRAGGETGVRAVRCLTGDAVWHAGRDGVYSRALLLDCLERLQNAPDLAERPLEERVAEPVLFHIVYRDGLRANVLILNGAVGQWAAAWRYASGATEATLFWVQEERPFMHFSNLLAGITRMVHTGQPAWPVQRTLLTSGMLDALHVSKQHGGRWEETPHLEFAYTSNWRWTQPPLPPVGSQPPLAPP